MAFNVAEFSSKVNQLGLLKSSSVMVEIFPGSNFGLRNFGGVSTALENMRFSAEATNVPGVSLSTTEIRRHGYGVIEKKPYVPIFTDIDVVFRSDKKGDIYKFIQAWMKMIINFDGRGSINSVTGILPSQAMYEVAYKDSYMSTIVIHVLDPNGNEPLTYVLLEAYPIFIGQIPMAWAAVNDYVKIPVKFSFKDWYLQGGYGVSPDNLRPPFRPQANPQPFNQPVNN
jgi:hypothetical protein